MWGNSAAYAYLLKAKQVTSFITNDDLFVIGRNDEKYIGEYKPLIISGKAFIDWIEANVVLPQAPLCNVVLGVDQPSVTTIISTVNFTKSNGTDPNIEKDIIIPGYVEITRPDDGEFIFNIVGETFVDLVSPINTEWNGDGWSGLDNLSTRTFSSFYTAIGNDYSGANIMSKELIMKIGSNYYFIQFTSWEDSTGNGESSFSYQRREFQYVPEVPCRITFSDGTYIDKKPLPELISCSNGSINVSPSTLPSGQILYDLTTNNSLMFQDTVFIDINHGNDLTAQPGNFNKPYRNLYSAQVANPKIYWFRPGVYDSSYFYPSQDTTIYCDPGVTFTNAFFQFFTANVKFRMFGKPRIVNSSTGRVFNINASGNDFYADVDGITCAHEPLFVFAPTIDDNPTNAVLNCNRINGQIFTSSSCISARGNVNVTVNADYMEGNYVLIGTRYHKGTFNCNIKKMVLKNGGTIGNSSFWKAVVGLGDTIVNEESIVNITGDIYGQSDPYIGGQNSCIRDWGNGLGKCTVTYTGNMYGNEIPGLSANNIGYNYTINGNINSKIRNIYTGSDGTVKINNSLIEKTSGGSLITNEMIALGGSSKLTMSNCNIKDSSGTSGEVIKVYSNACSLNLMNCLSRSNPALFINFNTFTPSYVLRGCVADKPLDPLIIAQPFEFVENVLINI